MESNSLGSLCASDSQDLFEPARLHWEGGLHGEKKTQEAKPMVVIRRGDYSDWTNLWLVKIHRNSTIENMLAFQKKSSQDTKNFESMTEKISMRI